MTTIPSPDSGLELLVRSLGDASTPAAFYQGWLQLQARTIDGVIRALLMLGERGSLYDAAARWPERVEGDPGDDEAAFARLRRLSERSLAERAVIIEGSPGGSSASIGYPIIGDGAVHGVVTLELRDLDRQTAGGESRRDEVLRRLEWSCAWLIGVRARQNAGRRGHVGHTTTSAVDTALEVLSATVTSERFRESATAFVGELARRLHCDRVSLGFIEGHQARLHAVSGNGAGDAGPGDSSAGDAPALRRAIEAAMDEAFDQKTRVVFPPSNGEVAVDRAHRELARRHGSETSCSLPLRHRGEIVGVLTLERSAERAFEESTFQLCDALATVAGPILELERREDRPLHAKIGDTLARGARRLFGPRHPRLKLACAAVGLFLLAICIARVDYRVSAHTVLEGSTQRFIAAPFDGYIEEALARAGDRVAEGDVLCVLEDKKLKHEQSRLVHEYDQLRKEHDKARAEGDRATVKITAAKMAQTRAQLDLVEDQLSRTRLKAPMEALVVAGDLSQSIGRAVERGEMLFQLAPLRSYRVILEVDERDIADVEVGQPGKILLSALIGEAIPFSIEKVTPVSTASEGRNFFRVEARLEESHERLRPGMEGVGKIVVGRRQLIWVWTHRAIDWLRLTLWRWLP